MIELIMNTIKQIMQQNSVNFKFEIIGLYFRKSSIKGFVARGLLTKTRFVSGGHMIETLSSLT